MVYLVWVSTPGYPGLELLLLADGEDECSVLHGCAHDLKGCSHVLCPALACHAEDVQSAQALVHLAGLLGQWLAGVSSLDAIPLHERTSFVSLFRDLRLMVIHLKTQSISLGHNPCAGHLH